jgi:hypothetical protein
MHTTHLTGVTHPQLEVLDVVVRDIAPIEQVVLDSGLDVAL